MNQFFSFKRFTLLVSKHWADNKKRYVLTLLAYIGLLIAGAAFSMFIPENKGGLPADLQQGAFFFSLFVTGTFYSSQYFSHLGSKAKASNLLLVPASTFEKTLCSLLYTILLFLLAFTASFYLVDMLMVSMANRIAINNPSIEKSKIANVFTGGFFRFNDNWKLNFFFLFIPVQAAFLLGSVCFKKYTFLKTIIGLFLAWLAVFSIVYILQRILLPTVDDLVEIPDSIARFLCILAYVTGPMLWIFTFYRMKRKQV